MGCSFFAQTAEKSVIASQWAHWRGNPFLCFTTGMQQEISSNVYAPLKR